MYTIASSSEVWIHWPLAGSLALQQRDQDALGRENPGAQIGDRDADAHRAFTGCPGDGHQPAHALRDLVEARARREGSRLAEAGDAGVHQARIGGRQCVVVDAETVFDIGPEVLDDDVRACDQALQRRNALGFLEVERDRALVPVSVLVVGAVLSSERIVAAHVLGHLHLDDVRAPVRQLAAGRGARANLGEIDDAKALQRGGSRQVWHVDALAWMLRT